MQSTLRAMGIDKLSIDERMHLVEEIWDSIAAEQESLPVPQSHRDELDRRLAAYQANLQAGASWEEVKAPLLEQS